MSLPSTSTVFASQSMVCTIDQLASAAALEILNKGGNAVDAAIAANAVLAITSQHMNGLGGDLWALIHEPGQPVQALNASGRAGSGADPQRLRDEGLTVMPYRGSVASSPVPGVVDGWLAMQERYGSMDMDVLLAAAISCAEDGFASSSQLARSSAVVSDVAGNTQLANLNPGDKVVRPRVARNLRALVAQGRDGWYGGEFGEALIDTGAGEYTEADLAVNNADWVQAPSLDAWGHTLWTAPPNSQGYLSLASAGIAAGLDLPDDPNDPLFAHFLIEASRAAAYDRPDVLHEHAESGALLNLDMLAERRARIDPNQAVSWGDSYADGGTMYMCVVDSNGMGVSLIQSNAAGFGAHVMVGDTGIFLHNRGIGFNLTPGHPAEYGPGRRPPHTLSPALITNPDGTLRSVLGTMGGDAQPQIVLQMFARMLHIGESPGQVLNAGRFNLASPDPKSGFDTWTAGGEVRVLLEPHVAHWAPGLTERGHVVEVSKAADLSGFGHAHLIEVLPNGSLAGAADPRAKASAALGR